MCAEIDDAVPRWQKWQACALCRKKTVSLITLMTDHRQVLPMPGQGGIATVGGVWSGRGQATVPLAIGRVSLVKRYYINTATTSGGRQVATLAVRRQQI